ncbi:MAG: CocE/NonD family hydrolase [Candidatus Dormibacteria bacterium]
MALLLLGSSVVGFASPSTATAAPAGSGWPGGKWQPYPAKYGVKIESNVPITMSDGVTLIGDVQYPADPATGARAAGKFPVLLQQNPYACTIPASVAANPLAGTGTAPPAFFAGRGYIFAMVCVRGAGRSGGDFTFENHEKPARDGVELVDWAAHKLDGSNGIVGLTGCSYLGIDQLFTASLLPKGSPVKEISPFCAGAEIYHEGSLRWGMPTQTTHFFGGSAALFDARAGAWGAQFYASIMSGGYEAFYNHDWFVASPGNYVDDIVRAEIPALFWSGYQDIFAQGSQEMAAYMQNSYFGRPTYRPLQPGDAVTGRYQVVVGPWGHGIGIDSNLQLEWYDTWLKGEDTGMQNTSTPNHLWDVTAHHWVNTATFPVTPTYTPYYLGAGGTFTPGRPAAPGSDMIKWAHPDVPGSTLTYTSTALMQGGTIAGPIGARLYASSSNTNLELIATLFDVAPDGTATNLTHGSVVGATAARDEKRSWYDSSGLPIRPFCVCDKAVYLTPGEVQPFDFWLTPSIITIQPGHAIRVVVSTETPEEVCANVLGPDSCEPTATQAQTLPGTYTLRYSAQAPSLINLPLLPLNAFEPAGTGPAPRDWGTLGATGMARGPLKSVSGGSIQGRTVGMLPVTAASRISPPRVLAFLAAVALVVLALRGLRLAARRRGKAGG